MKKTCKKCEKPTRAKGLCWAHYAEARRREAGMLPRESREGAKRLDVFLSPADLERLHKAVPEGRRSAFIREAIRFKLNLDKAMRPRAVRGAR